MTRTIEMVLTDAATGDLYPLLGMIDHVLFTLNTADENRFETLERLIRIAFVKWGIPRNVATETLYFLL